MNKIGILGAVFKSEGIKGVLRAINEKIYRFITRTPRFRVHFLARNEDILECEWDINPRTFTSSKKEGPFIFNWVMHPPGRGSGGHQNLFRFISFLENAGHTCRIYLYTSTKKSPIELIEENIDSSYTPIKASMEWLDGEMAPSDAIFATGWETCYPVYNQKSSVKRFYFVQDFEPYFYHMGSEFALAENTYKFGFTGITAGRWLSSKLQDEFEMTCDFYDFGVDTSNYRCTNVKSRNKVFFYARPVTSRRGFELGVLTLQKFHDLNPDAEIVMAGWDVSNYEIGFPYTNLSVVNVGDLSNVYNECAAALILSFSNMSLLPLELLSAGVIPVINKGPNNEMVVDNKFLKYCEASPAALAFALSEVLNNEDQVETAKKASKSVSNQTWIDAGSKFVSIVEREMRG